MEFLVVVICGVMGVSILEAILLLPLRYKFIAELKRKDRKELENLVFRFETEYFDYLGCENEDVIRFKALVDARDVSELLRSWEKFNRSFKALERRIGHGGRPLIMDYYNWYELEIKELYKRSA